MLIVKNRKKNRPGVASRGSSQEDFARPRRPIRVILARDEEQAISDVDINIEEEEPKNLPPPPPAYGLWRGSMVRNLTESDLRMLAESFR